MQPHALIMWGVVFAIGIPCAWRNPTAAALVIAKIAGWGYYQITADNLPVEFYLFPDIFVLAVIMAKQEHCNRQPYRNGLDRLKCILLERSPADRAVMLAFMACWLLYAAPIHDYYRWWSLWGLTVLQFLFAGAESLEIFWRRRAARVVPTPIIDRHLKVIQFPVQRRDADAVRITPEPSGALLTAYRGGGGG